MINIPTTLCSCEKPKSSIPVLYELNPIDSCITECEEKEPVELIPIISSLCACPVVEEIINFNPPPRVERIIKTCFTDFIKNMTSTKFCDNGPTCNAK